MKYKILSIIICMMLLSTIFAVGENVKEKQKNIKDETEPLIFIEDLPVWDSGQSWTYNIDNIEFAIDDENLSEDLTLIFNLQIGEFTIEVANDLGYFYEVEIIETPITGDYLIKGDLGDGPIEVNGAFENTKLSGVLLFKKDNLGISEINIVLDGKLTVNVVEQPYVEVSVFPEAPIPMTLALDIEMDPALAFLSFPIEVPSAWGLSAMNVTFGGTIDSIWLKIVNFLNVIMRKFNLIRPIARLLKTDEAQLQQLSDMLDDILPTVDIEHILDLYMGVDNSFPTPEIPTLFFCNNTVDITTPADTFYDAYEIQVLGGIGTIYYASEAENIVKMEGNFNDLIPFINDIDIVLTDYS